MTQPELADCIDKEDKFLTGQVTENDILNEIDHIERTDTWTFTGPTLRTFWRNAIVCLKKADIWALRDLIFAVLPDLPDLHKGLAAGMSGGIPSMATTVADMLYLLNAVTEHKPPFSWFSRSKATSRRLQALAASPDDSQKSRKLLEIGLSEVERNIRSIQQAANKAVHNKPSKILIVLRNEPNGTEHLQVTSDDVEIAVQALQKRVNDLRRGIDESTNS
jgi:hypothetical protein